MGKRFGPRDRLRGSLHTPVHAARAVWLGACAKPGLVNPSLAAAAALAACRRAVGPTSPASRPSARRSRSSCVPRAILKRSMWRRRVAGVIHAPASRAVIRAGRPIGTASKRDARSSSAEGAGGVRGVATGAGGVLTPGGATTAATGAGLRRGARAGRAALSGSKRSSDPRSFSTTARGSGCAGLTRMRLDCRVPPRRYRKHDHGPGPGWSTAEGG